MAAATLGAGLAAGFKKISHLGLCVLISFAAGALLAVSVFDILPETIESIGPVKGLVSFVSGYLVFFLLTKFVFHVCPACSATHTEMNFKAITVSMVAALSVHSFMDGLAIAGGVETSMGLMILLAVVYHKIPEGMALTLVASGSGMARPKAFLMSCALEWSTTLAGGAAGFLLPSIQRSGVTGFLLGHAGGGFVFLVVHALLSETVKHHPRYTLVSAAAGGLSILAVQYCF